MIDTCTTPMLSVYDGREIGELTTHSGDDRPGLLDQHEQVSRELHAATINDPLRRRLPQRRGAIAVELEHTGHRFRMQIGCFPDGALGEVFLDAAKQNSGLDALRLMPPSWFRCCCSTTSRPPRSVTRYAALRMVRRRV
jgi:hypothetical protein